MQQTQFSNNRQGSDRARRRGLSDALSCRLRFLRYGIVMLVLTSGMLAGPVSTAEARDATVIGQTSFSPSKGKWTDATNRLCVIPGAYAAGTRVIIKPQRGVAGPTRQITSFTEYKNRCRSWVDVPEDRPYRIVIMHLVTGVHKWRVDAGKNFYT